MPPVRRRKGSGGKRPEQQSEDDKENNKLDQSDEKSNSANLNVNLNVNLSPSCAPSSPVVAAERSRRRRWNCVDSCCWFVGCVCSMWWFLLFLYNTMPASFPQYVTEAITGPLPDPPGVKLAKEGLQAKHPVLFVPGIVTGGLELWEGHACAEGLFRKRLWGGTFGEVYKRYCCWLLIC